MKGSVKSIGWLCLVAFLLTLYYFYNPVTTLWTPKCPFKLATGLQCPGCGIQRALHALLQGHYSEAIHYNYFLLFSGPYILSFGVRALLPQGQAKDSLTKIIEDKRLIWLYIILFFIWFIVRNILKI
ncbi:DUF2752 domain-containing protein [Prevotella jejuni]